MDPATIISLLAAAAGALGTEAIKDLYEAVKHRIKNLFAKDEYLLEALEDFEAKPQSSLKQKTLQGQIERTNLGKTPEVIEPLTKLESVLIGQGLFVPTSYAGTQSGSGSLAQGNRATAAGEGGVAIGGDMHGDITINPVPTDPVQKAKNRYLERLINEFQTLPLAAMGGGDELKGEVTLDQVYIDLDTQTPRDEPTTGREADKIPRAQRHSVRRKRSVHGVGNCHVDEEGPALGWAWEWKEYVCQGTLRKNGSSPAKQ